MSLPWSYCRNINKLQHLFTKTKNFHYYTDKLFSCSCLKPKNFYYYYSHLQNFTLLSFSASWRYILLLLVFSTLKFWSVNFTLKTYILKKLVKFLVRFNNFTFLRIIAMRVGSLFVITSSTTG